MRAKKLHTSINLLVEPELYQSLRMTANLEKTSMSEIIRDGIRLKLEQIKKKNNAIMGGE